MKVNGCRLQGRRENAVVVVAVFLAMVAGCSAATFWDNFQGFADSNHVVVLNNGLQVQLILDQQSASGFGSKNTFLFGHISMQIKLVPGNSAGTVTAYYLSSGGTAHDEMDFEFLGNVSGQPYLLQTNVYAQGVGNREQRVGLWFDPTADFHTYSVLWNKNQILFQVDNTTIRVYKDNEDLGVPYPNSQPMGLYSSLWNGDQWATRGGLDKLNWTSAPFIATYQQFDGLDACTVYNNDTSACLTASNNWWEASAYQSLDSTQVANWPGFGRITLSMITVRILYGSLQLHLNARGTLHEVVMVLFLRGA